MTTQRQDDAVTSGQPRNENEQARESRRRFLKGTTLALPAVTTLTPGAAQALTSITCGQRGLDSNLSADFLLVPPSNTDDGHFRMPVAIYDRYVPHDDGHGNITMVPSNQPAYFQGLDQGVNVWRHCDDGSIAGTDEPEDINLQTNLNLTGYAIVHIDAADGQVVSCGSPDNPPNAIITSAAGACMNSLAMMQG